MGGGGGIAIVIGCLIDPVVSICEIVKEAEYNEHELQGPSSHERSLLLHNDATSISLPMLADVALSAAAGRPLPAGLPAIFRSNDVTTCAP